MLRAVALSALCGILIAAITLSTGCDGDSGSGESAFSADLVFHGRGGFTRGYYALNGNSLSIVADTSTLIPDGGGDTFSNFGQDQADTSVGIGDGFVVFAGRGSSGDKGGVYVRDANGLTVVADRATSVPPVGFDPFTGFGRVAASDDLVVFQGINQTIPKRGIYGWRDGELFKIADNTTLIPDGGTDLFGQFNGPIAVDGDVVAFYATTLNGAKRGIYRYDTSGLSVVANVTTEIPDAGGELFVNFEDGADAIDVAGDTVLFCAGKGTVPVRGIYKHDGVFLSRVVDNSDFIPDGQSDKFISFQGVAADDISRLVAFTGGNGNVGKDGVFTTGATGLEIIALTGVTSLPDSASSFSSLAGGSSVVAVAGERVYFSGEGESAIYLHDGKSISVAVDDNTAIPGSLSEVFEFFEYAASAR